IRDTNWQTNPNTLEAQPVARERRAFGDGSVVSGGGMYNMEIPLAGTKTTFYSFGGYNYKHSNVYAYTRSWNYDNGLRQNPTDNKGFEAQSVLIVFNPSDKSLVG
ncbi:MAG: iron complex outerrane recepter protein, partial [Candidatus Nomurabacteria bacterium]|nr:iron complex outerrane recepter protein [Candidatus Nomurabacteria bacterium]